MAPQLVTLIITVAAITAFVLGVIFIAVPLFRGIGWMVASVFKGIGWLIVHVFEFIAGM